MIRRSSFAAGCLIAAASALGQAANEPGVAQAQQRSSRPIVTA